MSAIGIDLGTTNSATSSYDPERKEVSVLTNSSGKNLTPSVVGLYRRDGAERFIVGDTAVKWAARQPRETVVSVKRLMGRAFADPLVEQAREKLSYEITQGPDGDPRARVRMGDRVLSPDQVSALILRQLAQDASRSLGEEVTHAVITVPAYFGDAQRAATRDAAEQAELVVKKIIDEPTAAAVAFGLHKKSGERSRILVYDLGGGTFDISILHAVKNEEGHGQFHVLRFDGDSWLGGDDFDQAIVDRIVTWVKDTYGIDPSGDKNFLYAAKEQAEQAKWELNAQESTDIVILAAHRAPDGTVIDVEMPLTRSEFDGLIEPMVRRTMTLVDKTLTDEGLTADDITDVLLVGGSTLTRAVYETVENRFGKDKVRRNINPMECVALGAGILAGTLHAIECPEPECQRLNAESATECEDCGRSLANARSVGDTGLHEVTGPAMGIAAVRGSQRDVFVPIIPSGTPYPLPEPRRQTFETTDGRRIRVPVYEGNQSVASRNVEQGVIEFELPEDIGLHRRVEVSFNYSLDRIIKVRISVPGTDLVKEDTPNRDQQGPPAAQHEEQDAAGLGPTLEHVAKETREFLADYEEYMEPSQRMKVERDLELVQRALDRGESGEYARLTDLLLTDMYNHCGLASKLMQAKRATDGASPQLGQQIIEAVGHVRTAHERGNREQVTQQARNLTNLVARAMDERSVAEVPTAEDYGSHLRVPIDRLDT
ncbi:molecular chaperone DnaK [Streptomyces albiaxialis]|uniref:Molecular chaperone DnaK n=1 Tax=Streptomyces albiaxialis TaxID=329523 RepID=A0ABN2W3P2_9ACTN